MNKKSESDQAMELAIHEREREGIVILALAGK